MEDCTSWAGSPAVIEPVAPTYKANGLTIKPLPHISAVALVQGNLRSFIPHAEPRHRASRAPICHHFRWLIIFSLRPLPSHTHSPTHRPGWFRWLIGRVQPPGNNPLCSVRTTSKERLLWSNRGVALGKGGILTLRNDTFIIFCTLYQLNNLGYRIGDSLIFSILCAIKSTVSPEDMELVEVEIGLISPKPSES